MNHFQFCFLAIELAPKRVERPKRVVGRWRDPCVGCNCSMFGGVDGDGRAVEWGFQMLRRLLFNLSASPSRWIFAVPTLMSQTMWRRLYRFSTPPPPLLPSFLCIPSLPQPKPCAVLCAVVSFFISTSLNSWLGFGLSILRSWRLVRVLFIMAWYERMLVEWAVQ